MLTLRQSPFDLFQQLEQQLQTAERVPAAEVRDTETGYRICLELPGVDRASIDVKATDRSLVISAERRAPEAAADAEARGWSESRKVNDVTLSQLKANGMTVTAPSPQLKADMKKVGDTMLKEWLDKAGAEGKALVDAYNKK